MIYDQNFALFLCWALPNSLFCVDNVRRVCIILANRPAVWTSYQSRQCQTFWPHLLVLFTSLYFLWWAQEVFPKDVLRNAAKLGFGGKYKKGILIYKVYVFSSNGYIFEWIFLIYYFLLNHRKFRNQNLQLSLMIEIKKSP